MFKEPSHVKAWPRKRKWSISGKGHLYADPANAMSHYQEWEGGMNTKKWTDTKTTLRKQQTKRFNFPREQYLFNSRNKRSGVKIWICAKYKQQLPFLLYLPLFCDIYSALDFTAIHQHLGHYKKLLNGFQHPFLHVAQSDGLFSFAFSHK